MTTLPALISPLPSAYERVAKADAIGLQRRCHGRTSQPVHSDQERSLRGDVMSIPRSDLSLEIEVATPPGTR